MVVDVNTEQVPSIEEVEGDPLMSLERAAHYMDVSVKQVRRWVEQGALRVVRFGPKLIRVRKSAVETFINSHCDALN